MKNILSSKIFWIALIIVIVMVVASCVPVGQILLTHLSVLCGLSIVIPCGVLAQILDKEMKQYDSMTEMIEKEGSFISWLTLIMTVLASWASSLSLILSVCFPHDFLTNMFPPAMEWFQNFTQLP